MPEPVDVAYFDPAAATRPPLPMGEQVFGPSTSGGWGRPYVFLSVGEPSYVAARVPAAATCDGTATSRTLDNLKPPCSISLRRCMQVFKWERRKGWDVLLEAYLRAFGSGDGVALILLTKPYHGSSDYRAQMHGELDFCVPPGLIQPAATLPTLSAMPACCRMGEHCAGQRF